MDIFRKIKGFVYYSFLAFRSRKFKEEAGVIGINSLQLHYFVLGPEDGLPVVLLHGNGGSHRSMRTQARELALAGYRVYSPDSRGQGCNEPLEEYHYADMASDTLEFIRKMKLRKPAVYGWSDGGIIALMLEMAEPGTCSLIAISGANLTPDCGDDFEKFKEWILAQGTPLALMMLKEPDIKPEELSAIRCPVLVTAGSRDLISEEHTRLIASAIPDSELIIVPKATHGSFIKKDPRMGRLLLSFFKRRGYFGKKRLSIAVYLGSSMGKSGIWSELVHTVSKEIAGLDAEVIYGGADSGLMGVLADSLLENGVRVTGVFPNGFAGRPEVAAANLEIARKDLARLIIVKDFAGRKAKMEELSDCALVLPGAYGTFDELFSYAVGNQIGVHDKPVFILNYEGYYDNLRAQVERMRAEGFLNANDGSIRFIDTPAEFIEAAAAL